MSSLLYDRSRFLEEAFFFWPNITNVRNCRRRRQEDVPEDVRMPFSGNDGIFSPSLARIATYAGKVAELIALDLASAVAGIKDHNNCLSLPFPFNVPLIAMWQKKRVGVRGKRLEYHTRSVRQVCTHKSVKI